ncbi:MAG: hypothetical protein WB699_14950 [Bacteroidota bacterium]
MTKSRTSRGTHNRSHQRSIRIPAAFGSIALAFLSLSGCVSIEPSTLDHVAASHKEQVIVFCKDGRVMKLAAEKYSIDSTAPGPVLKGEGWEYNDSARLEMKPYKGDIPLAVIDSVQTFAYTISPGAWVGIGVAVLFALTLGRFLWGL